MNNKAGGGERLVRASGRVAAENFVSCETIFGRLASQEDLVSMLGRGVVVENARDESKTSVLELDVPQ